MSEANSISLCMIVRDEEDVLGRCLESVYDLVDEIVIVDTGSQDGTKEIAAAYTERIFDFTWIDDFAAARNAAFAKASCAYCMWLDADDVLLAADRQKFKDLKAGLGAQVDVVMLPYNVGFDAQGNVTFSYYRERIIRNNGTMCWQGAVHEAISPKGQVIYGDCAVTHWKLHPSDPDRNLRIFEGLLAKGELLEPRQQFYYGRELYYHKQYERALAVFEAFLADGRGWLENKLDACRHAALCLYGLGQRQRALAALLHSFAYDLPRAEICCDLGRHFVEEEAWEQAIYWYQRALDCQRRDASGGFVQQDAYGYLPCLQICVCYNRLGRNIEAAAYNERGAQFKPDCPAVAYNRAYFAALQNEAESEPGNC